MRASSPCSAPMPRAGSACRSPLDRLTGRFGEASIRPASLLGRDQGRRVGYSEKPLRPARCAGGTTTRLRPLSGRAQSMPMRAASASTASSRAPRAAQSLYSDRTLGLWSMRGDAGPAARDTCRNPYLDEEVPMNRRDRCSELGWLFLAALGAVGAHRGRARGGAARHLGQRQQAGPRQWCRPGRAESGARHHHDHRPERSGAQGRRRDPGSRQRRGAAPQRGHHARRGPRPGHLGDADRSRGPRPSRFPTTRCPSSISRRRRHA